MLADLLKNIAAGTRGAFFMPIQLWTFRGGFIQVCLLLLISIALTLVHDYVYTLPHHVFNPYGISYQGLLYFLFFFSLVLIARLKRRLPDIDKLVVMFLSIVPAIWLGTLTLSYLFEQQDYLDPTHSNWLVFFIYIAWYLMVAFRLFKRFFYIPVLPAAAFVCVYALINFLPLFTLPATPLWQVVTPAAMSTGTAKPVDIESVYYNQSAQLAHSSAAISPGQAGRTDMYFIGFAGHADEDVFMNEARSAERIVNQQFMSYGRSALLINNSSALSSYPLANQHNLELLLQDTASKMDAEDILFLFITSHGNEQHEISTDFYPFRLNSLAPDAVKQMLDSVAIKWRIIIVSACYSGGFIDALADPSTLLITAARHDRNSFGCGHDGNYTFFGDAFFEQGLKRGLTLQAAFDQATAIIREKEDGQGFQHSEPQWFLGQEMAGKLANYESERQQMQSSNWARSGSESMN